MHQLIIAIDGHASTGKGTIARQLAQKLSYVYIDSGAMYRAVTLFSLQNNCVDDFQVLENKLAEINITFVLNPDTQRQETYLNGVNVEAQIRGIEVSENVSKISANPVVRQKLVAMQRQMSGRGGGMVMDGRDIGTVVFPEADLKLFMTADARVRAQRRFDELNEKGEKVDFDTVLHNIESRDLLDSTRSESPLRQAEDALLLDNSTMTPEQQLQWVLEKVNKIINEK